MLTLLLAVIMVSEGYANFLCVAARTPDFLDLFDVDLEKMTAVFKGDPARVYFPPTSSRMRRATSRATSASWPLFPCSLLDGSARATTWLPAGGRTRASLTWCFWR